MDNEKELTHIDLFSGIGGFTLAAEWAGFRTIVFCEKEEFCQKVLQKRFGAVIADPEQSRKLQSAKSKQKKRGWIGDCPILISEIRDFDGTKYQGATLLTGGFPCQPFSVAGPQRGKEDDRYLWPQMLRVISEAKPCWILAENVPGIFRMALDTVLSDLEGEGYATGTFIIPACGLNAPHRRNRVWIVANSSGREVRGQSRGTLIRTEDKGRGDATNRMPSICSREKTSFSAELGQTDRHATDSPKQGLERSISKRKTRSERCSAKYINDASNPTRRRQLKCLSERKKERDFGEGDRWDFWQENWYEIAAKFCRVDDGISDRIHRLKALGNAIVPQIAHEILKNIAWIENELAR